MKRGGPIKRKRKPAGQLRDEAEVRAVVFARAGWCCQLYRVAGAGRCMGDLTYQHRRKASQGGKYTVENGAALCAHHNTELEANPDLARLGVQLGLVLLRA